MAALKFASKDGRGTEAHDVCTLTVHLAPLAYKLEVQKLARMPIFEPPSLADFNLPIIYPMHFTNTLIASTELCWYSVIAFYKSRAECGGFPPHSAPWISYVVYKLQECPWAY